MSCGGFKRYFGVGMKFDDEYKKWLTSLKSRIRQSQIKAAIKVNTELLLLYWDLGHDIAVRQMEKTWGSGFFEQLSNDLRNEFPDMQGFSVVNLTYCKRFYLFYTQGNPNRQQLVDELNRPQLVDEIMPQLGGQLQVVENKGDAIFQQAVEEFENHPIFQIPWGHHIQIFTKCKSLKEALFYVQKTIENGWSMPSIEELEEQLKKMDDV